MRQASRSWSAAAVGALALATMARAQTMPLPRAGADTGAEATAGAVQDIVVTGERREARLQDVPLAITSVGGDALRQRNLNELADLNGYVPGLTVAKNEGAERVIAIRGIGYETATNPNSQPGVAFHIDGVYVASVLALNQDLLDVDHIEVLRGPQGTVFGQTSTGGAINVITRKPVIGKWEGHLAASYGTFNLAKIYGGLNVPLGDTLALRTAVQYLRHDGYAAAIAVPGRRRYGLDDADNIGARATLLWQPSDRFSAELAGQTFDADHHAAAQKCILCRDFDGDPASYIADPLPNPRRLSQDFPGRFRTATRMIYLTLAQDLGDVATLRSVTSYQSLNKHQSSDNDRLAYRSYFDNIVFWQDRSRTWTQEVSLTSRGTTRVEWTAGGFFLHQDALQKITEYSSAGFVPDPASPANLVSFATDSPYTHVSWAGYGQATWHATDRLSLVGGLRYNHDRISAQPLQYFGLFGVSSKRVSSQAVTGKLSAEYRVAPDSIVYVTGSKGYKPAGLNFNTAPLLVGQSLRQERVYAAEIGSKNTLFDRRVQLNAAGYYYGYRNFQFTAEDLVPNQGGTTNIPHADVYGVELEATVIPVPALRLDGNVSLGRGRFRGHFLTLDPQAANIARLQAGTAGLGYSFGGNPAGDAAYFAFIRRSLQDTDGNRVPKLPGVQGRIGATYTAELGRAGQALLRGELIYRGAFRSRIFDNGPFDRVPAYLLGNLYLEYRPARSRFTASLAVQNVADKAGVSNIFANPYGSGTTSAEYVPPREVIGTLAYRF